MNFKTEAKFKIDIFILLVKKKIVVFILNVEAYFRINYELCSCNRPF